MLTLSSLWHRALRRKSQRAVRRISVRAAAATRSVSAGRESSGWLTHACQDDKPKEEVKSLTTTECSEEKKKKYAQRVCELFHKFLEVNADPDKGWLRPVG